MKEVKFKMEFVNYNANPKNKKTGDCVIRALCTALEDSWEQVYKLTATSELYKTNYTIRAKDLQDASKQAKIKFAK